MSPLALALALSLSPAAAPDAENAERVDTKVEQKSDKRARAAKAKKRRQRRRATQRDLAEVLALEPAPAAAATTLPTAPALAATTPEPALGGKPTKNVATPSLSVPQTSLSLAGLMWPGLLLCTLAGAVLFFRRKRTQTRSLDVVEAVSVGKGRDLVVVDVAGSRMLLGCTDGGISVLEKSLPRHTPLSPNASHERASAGEGSVAAALVQALRGSFSRLKGNVSNTAAFEQHLESTEGAPCSEQEELARKLQARINSRKEATNPGFELGRINTRSKAVRA